MSSQWECLSFTLSRPHTLFFFSISLKTRQRQPFSSRFLADFAIGVHLPGCSPGLISIGMAAATSKPEMPTFSYAQAAKGISTASTTSQPSKPTSIDQNKGARYDEMNSSHQPSASVSTLPAETEVGGDSESSETSEELEPKSPSDETQQPVTVTDSSKQEASGPSSPTSGTASTSTLPKDDDISSTINEISDTVWDRQSQASGPNEKTSVSGEGQKDSSSTTASENSFAPRELKAAPIPVVNVWQQRKEAQEAKAKATAAALKSVPPNNLSPKTAPGKPSNGVSHPPPADHNDSKAAGKKKPAELPNDGATFQGKDRKRADIGKGKDESELSLAILLLIH